MNKAVSILLVFVMLVSILAVIPVSVSAEEIPAEAFSSDEDFSGVSVGSESRMDLSSSGAEEELSAVKATENGYDYRVSDGKAIITGYSNHDVTALALPEKLGGYSVTAIDKRAFIDFAKLTSDNRQRRKLRVGCA